ncbi:hypothetical protein C8R43DRAFT_889063 [Mycena crocata]|nr:hypothetical protein C8R43DRAFT_889063 [Mycena crocata]
MLLLFFLVHFLSTNSISLPRSQPDTAVTANSCDDIHSCRRRFDIVWSCLATIFVCTWVSVHPNLPPPNQSLLWRKLRMMLITVVAPEVMMGFAWRQFYAARSFEKDFKIPRSHGFFISMGGFVSRLGHNPVVVQKQFDTVPEYLADMRAVGEAEIMDKSKGDGLSKAVALIQGLWFTIQCLARVQQRLPVCELEITTLAFAVVNTVIYWLWREKPLDVQVPILIGPRVETFKVESVDEEQSIPSTASQETVAVHAGPWRSDVGHAIGGAIRGIYPDYKPTRYTSVPSFWSADDLRSKDKEPFIAECLVGTIFGAIHCAAWNADFLSVEEKWIWRATALLVAAVPGMVALAVWARDFVDGQHSVWSSRLFIVGALGITIYPIARLFLIVLPIIALRALAPGELTAVNWSTYIPHF